MWWWRCPTSLGRCGGGLSTKGHFFFFFMIFLTHLPSPLPFLIFPPTPPYPYLLRCPSMSFKKGDRVRCLATRFDAESEEYQGRNFSERY